MGATLNWSIQGGGRFRQLEYCYNGIIWSIVWGPNKAIDIGAWSICGGDQLERVHCICIHIYTHIHM